MDYLSGINQFTQVAAQLSVLLLIVRVAFGALNCFMGYRMLKFWISVCGFFLGTGIGMAAVYILQLSGNVTDVVERRTNLVHTFNNVLYF